MQNKQNIEKYGKTNKNTTILRLLNLRVCNGKLPVRLIYQLIDSYSNLKTIISLSSVYLPMTSRYLYCSEIHKKVCP